MELTIEQHQVGLSRAVFDKLAAINKAPDVLRETDDTIYFQRNDWHIATAPEQIATLAAHFGSTVESVCRAASAKLNAEADNTIRAVVKAPLQPVSVRKVKRAEAMIAIRDDADLSDHDKVLQLIQLGL